MCGAKKERKSVILVIYYVIAVSVFGVNEGFVSLEIDDNI